MGDVTTEEDAPAAREEDHATSISVTPGAGDAPSSRGSLPKGRKKKGKGKNCYRIGEKPRRSFWRSEEMLLCQIFFPAEIAYACLVALGKAELVEFLDLNDDVGSAERPYANELAQLERALDTLKHLEQEIKKNEIDYELEEDPEKPVDVPMPGDIIDITETLERLDNEITSEKKNIEEMEKQLEELRELKSTRDISDKYLAEESAGASEDNDEKETDERKGDQGAGSMKIKHTAGTINKDKYPPLEQVLYRSSRGKAFTRNEPIKEPFTQTGLSGKVKKDAFIVFFQGDQLKDRVKKILTGFRANIIETDENINDVKAKAENLEDQMKDLETVLDQTKDIYKQLLEALADNFEDWRDKVLKMKATYANLNKFKSKHHLAEGWVPKHDFHALKKILNGIATENNSTRPLINVIDPGNEEPPTYFKQDRITKGFQALIDAYGLATYKELNPMPYTVITFPFLFAMMFGDFGHGSILFVFGFWMVLKEDKLLKSRSKNEIRNIVVAGRYIIMFMGIFSMYNGIIYNDVFSRAFNIFGTYWAIDVSENQAMGALEAKGTIGLDPETDYITGPYPIGIDPAWQVSQNSIIFLNSFKMKISIIFGVLQMTFGLLLSLWNDTYFNQIINIWAEFIPEIIWLVCIFVWLCVLIFIKWFKFGPRKGFKQSPYCAPSVLITFIDMFVMKEYVEPAGCDKGFFPWEKTLEKGLLAAGLICIPWLLFAKPFALFAKISKERKKKGGRKSKRRKKTRVSGASLRSRLKSIDSGGSSSGEEDGPRRRKIRHKKDDETTHSHGEIMIHQGICTIEYILGTISHTASYLRLWALSLAHAQLSEVLWSMVMSIPAKFTKDYHYMSIILFFGIWLVWALLTIAILCLMEGLSAFLHTLRLHWVEFQSKFYSGLGYEFQPFNYEQILSAYRESH